MILNLDTLLGTYNDSLRSSYSQIDKYIKCPQSWAFRYKDKIRSNKKSKYLEYGLAIHETLEFLFKELQSGHHPNQGLIRDMWRYNSSKREIPFDTSEEEMEYDLNALAMINRLFNKKEYIEQLMTCSEILAVEMPFSIKFDVPEFDYAYTDTDGIKKTIKRDYVNIIGYIDLVLLTDEGIIVIDHKSGRKKYKKSILNSDLQFVIYHMAIEQKFGMPPAKCIYYFTQLGEFQEAVVHDRVEKGCEKIREVFKKMLNKTHRAIPTPLCYWCDYGKYNMGICKRSSNFKPRPKR